MTAFRARTETVFAHAHYFKPSEVGEFTPEAWQLSPLLILETAQGNTASTVTPEVFYQSGQVTLNGKTYPQMTYWWANFDVSRNSSEPPAQGVRITLNAAGQPAIWEVLADTSGARLIFVAQSLEGQAIREFGSPTDGRRFAVEPISSTTPNIVVARVIEDGPTVMGPIVYLCRGTHDVSTVACRCMDSQARDLVGMGEYQLTAAEMAKLPGPLRAWWRRVCREATASRLEQSLRIPHGF